MKTNFSLLSILCFAAVFISACSRQPFVEHKLKLEAVDKDCNALPDDFQMISNFGGERYEFYKCLPAGFTNDKLESSRSGDTVIIRFGTASNSKPFKVILDIDSYPAYHFISIDNETYTLAPAAK